MLPSDTSELLLRSRLVGDIDVLEDVCLGKLSCWPCHVSFSSGPRATNTMERRSTNSLAGLWVIHCRSGGHAQDKSHALCHALPRRIGCKFFHGLRNPEMASVPSKLKVAGSIPAGVAIGEKSAFIFKRLSPC
jgi:hypothetical protein